MQSDMRRIGDGPLRRIGEEGEESGTYTGDGGEHDEDYFPTLTLHTAADAQQAIEQNGDEESLPRVYSRRVTEQTGANVTRPATRIYWPPVVANLVQETYRLITEDNSHSTGLLTRLNLALALAFFNVEEAEEHEVRMLRHASAACDMMNVMKRKRRRTE